MLRRGVELLAWAGAILVLVTAVGALWTPEALGAQSGGRILNSAPTLAWESGRILRAFDKNGEADLFDLAIREGNVTTYVSFAVRDGLVVVDGREAGVRILQDRSPRDGALYLAWSFPDGIPAGAKLSAIDKAGARSAEIGFALRVTSAAAEARSDRP